MPSELKKSFKGHLFREFTASELVSIMDYSDGEFGRVLQEESHVGNRLEYSRYVFTFNSDFYQVELYMGYHEDYKWQYSPEEILACYLVSPVERVTVDYVRVKD